MRDIISISFKFQQAALQAMTTVPSLMMETYLHLLKQQFTFLDHAHAYHRRDDPHVAPVNPKARKRKGSKPRSPCCGPNLKDHYGNRAHDVDVEHI